MNSKTLIQKRERISDSCYSFTLYAPDIAKKCEPGQIIHVDCGGDTFLRRPFGICEASRTEGTIRFCYEIRGKGTNLLSEMKEGEELDILGAFGNGFPAAKGRRILLVGGGIGIFPLLFCAESSPESCDTILAFRCCSKICLEEDFRKYCRNVYLCTDDGSAGYKGYAAQLLSELNIKKQYDVVYVCGPMKMMKTVAEVCIKANIECFVSLEERMGCGVGACLGCAFRTIMPDGSRGYKRVCVDGPVFNASEVDWSEI